MAAHLLSTPVVGYPEKPAVDLSNAETRRRLSPAAIRGCIGIAEKWKLNENQIRSLLGGIASSTLHAWKSNPDKRVLDQDTLTRISLLGGIYQALHTYFGALGDHWITHPNDSPLFSGVTPIEYMMSAGLIGMYEVRRLLDAWSVGH
ncbi:MAG: antitoxin Xre-like helix-turn-helix domain-containing protein [Acidobacteriaceae bacterium]